MDRHAAIRYMHERHPDIIKPPDGEVTRGDLGLETFWLQGHVCERMDERCSEGLGRCFDTAYRMLVEGDPEVRDAVCEDFVLPHLAFHGELAWARAWMPPLIFELCERSRAHLEERFASPPGAARES